MPFLEHPKGADSNYKAAVLHRIPHTGQYILRQQMRRMEKVMSQEQIFELEEVKKNLLMQAYRMKQEHPHMSPVGIEREMYAALMTEIREITSRIQRSVEA